VWRNASSFVVDRASVRSWLLSIVHHRAIDVVRKRRKPAAPLESAVRAVDADARLQIPDVWPEVSARLDHASVRSALASINTSQRVALELAYFSGLTQCQIAARMNLPLGTVESRVRLGLAHLGAILADSRLDAHDAERLDSARIQ
jgi:RNA polymerase sigma-70 factor (ECF subfamily)